jgi:flavin-dependent dehydrogenase
MSPGRDPPLMTPLRPIEIVGGGLAGLSLGLALRRAGVPVTILEAGTYPRHRVCGEFITGLAPATIEALGLAPLLADALPHREVAWYFRGRFSRLQRLPAPALGLSRHALDARLAHAFVAAGGDLRVRTRLADPANRPGRVLAIGRRRGRSPWIGLKFHVRGLLLTRDLELHLGADSYVGLSRIECGAINVCGLFRRRTLSGTGPALLIAYLRAAGLAALAGRLEIATIEPDSFCAVAALCFGRTAPVSDDSIRIGDNFAMIPPFTGNGMAMAFQSAEAVLAPLLAFTRGEQSWPETCRAANATLRRRFRLRLASARAVHPFLLRPRRQRWLAALNRVRLVPLGPLYATLH